MKICRITLLPSVSGAEERQTSLRGFHISDGPNGSPVLDGALAFIECKVAETFTAGDHTLFIGSIVEAKLLKEDTDPLIFRWDDYF